MLLFSLFLSLFFASLVASYLHQLLNPQLLRTHTAQVGAGGAASSQYAYPLQQYPPNPYGQGSATAAPGYQAGFVPPPYNPAGGPPGYANDSGYEVSKEKEGGEQHGVDPSSDHQGQGGMTSQDYEQRQHDEEMRRRANESTDTVTLEPRRENEGRV